MFRKTALMNAQIQGVVRVKDVCHSNALVLMAQKIMNIYVLTINLFRPINLEVNRVFNCILR